MLTLTRKVGQIITIGDDITVTILDIEGAEPEVEIQAPDHLPIKREEVYYRLKNDPHPHDAEATDEPRAESV